ncbi:MAG: hypothetical protein ACFBSD_01265 [Paracoccaceae bacterium]
MAVIRVNADCGGTLRLADGGPAGPALAAVLQALAPGAPVAVLIHGFRYTWRRDVCACACPQARLYGTEPVPPSAKRRPDRAAWVHDLGFAGAGPETGLAIAFGWEARIGRHGRAGFPEIYARAGVAGRALAEGLAHALIGARGDGPRIDLFSHSLGARVALQAMAARRDLPWRRAILLSAAERREVGRAAATALPSEAEVLHVLSRANDPYDAGFERLCPDAGASLGRAGLGPALAPGFGTALSTGRGAGETARAEAGWMDLELDHPRVVRWLAARGHALSRAGERISHWHTYADPGAMAFWASLLRAGAEGGLAALRADGIPEVAGGALRPRWSRLAPRWPALRPAPVGDPRLTRI